MLFENKAKIKTALSIAQRYGGTDGSHHKQWVIDQMVRVLSGVEYANWVASHNIGEDGPNTYEWEEGSAP